MYEMGMTLQECGDAIEAAILAQLGTPAELRPYFLMEGEGEDSYVNVADQPFSSGTVTIQLSNNGHCLSETNPRSRTKTRITLDQPTNLEVFLAIERHYRALGAPLTDHLAVECLMFLNVSRAGHPVYTPFIGS